MVEKAKIKMKIQINIVKNKDGAMHLIVSEHYK